MPDIRLMSADDLPFGLRLSTQAGWNQTAADWQRFLALAPLGCFICEHDDGPIGTVCVFDFDGVAWIAMLLVDEASRGQRIGTALLRHAIDHAEQLGAKTIRLDATPMGERLYERFGFRVQYRLTRYHGRPVPMDDPPGIDAAAVRLARADDFTSIVAADDRVTATHRGRLLRHLLSEPGVNAYVMNTSYPLGFVLTRPGRLATYIGPCACSDVAYGEALLPFALEQHIGNPVMLDIPNDNVRAAAIAQDAGLEPQRPLARMIRGDNRIEHLHLMFASSGPEKG